MRQTAHAPFCRRRPPPLPAWAASRPPKTRPSRRPPSAALAGPRTIAALNMGRQTITQRPVPADFINECFEIVAGALVWARAARVALPPPCRRPRDVQRPVRRHSARVRLASFVPDVLVALASCIIWQTLSALRHARFELGCHRPLARNLAVVLGSVRRLRGRPLSV